METKKAILILVVMFFQTLCYAQEKDTVLPPPRNIIRTYTFTLPEVQVDSIFIARLNSILFKKENRYMNSLLSKKKNISKHFYLVFEKLDSTNYTISVELGSSFIRGAVGFFIHNNFYYWLKGEIPLNLILEKKTKKKFSYREESHPYTYDPSMWTLRYDCKTREFKLIETNSVD